MLQLSRFKTSFVQMLCVVMIIGGSSCGAGEKQVEPDVKQQKPAPDAEKKKSVMQSGVLRLPVNSKTPLVIADRAKNEIRITAEFSSVARALEFLLISETVRAYESAFITKADPAHIQLALFYLGVKPGMLTEPVPEGLAAERTVQVKGDAIKEEKRSTAPLIEIEVEWEEDGKICKLGMEKFIYHRGKKGLPDNMLLAFTGSYLVTVDGRQSLAAKQSNVIMAVLHDPSAVMNLPYYEDSPYTSDWGYEINATMLPPFFQRDKEIIEGVTARIIQVSVGRPVTLILRRSKSTSFKQPVAAPVTELEEKDKPQRKE